MNGDRRFNILGFTCSDAHFFGFHFWKAFDFLIFENVSSKISKYDLHDSYAKIACMITPADALNEDSYVDDSRIVHSDWERSSEEDS